MIDFTTVIGIDHQHERELWTVWPTWSKHRPELFQRPMVLLADAAIANESRLRNTGHPDVTVVTVPDMPGASQREKMLTALTLIAPFVVKTPWLLKLDTDTLARKHDPRWCSEELIQGNPVFVAPAWNYTKPSTAIQTLDAWGDTVPELKGKPRLDLPFDPAGNIVVTKGRIISWCFFGRVDWLTWAAGLCGKRLPVASHDSTLFYIARRNGDSFKTFPMKSLGWDHVSGRRLARECAAVMQG